MRHLLLLSFSLSIHTILFCQNWQSIITGSSPNQNEGITTEVYENKVYFGGIFEDLVSIGFNSANGLNGKDLFIGKTTLNGFTEWLIPINGTALDRISNIELSGDRLLVSGVFTDSLFLGTDTLINDYQTGAFIAYFDTLGNYIDVWAPDVYNADFKDFDYDSQGNLLITGDFYQHLTYGSFTMTGTGGNFFLLKYSPSLDSVLWAVQSQGDANYGIKMALDHNDNIYTTGAYNDGTYFIDTLINTGNLNHNMFVSKVDVNGNHLWLTTIEGTGEVHGFGIACDDTSNVFVVGEFEGVLDVQGNILTSNGSYDGIIVKYDSSGNYVWAENIGGTNSDEAYEIKLDKNNDPIVLLEAHSGAEYKGQTLFTNGFNEPLLVKIRNSDASLIWDRRLYSTQTSGVVQCVSMSQNNDYIAITGANRTSIVFNSQNYPAPNTKDFYVTILKDSLTYHLGIEEEYATVSEIQIYPNPTTDLIFLRCSIPIRSLLLYDSKGNLVQQKDVNKLNSTMKLNGLNNGIYFLIIHTQGKFETRKLILAR